jgi:hypothetical protein
MLPASSAVAEPDTGLGQWLCDLRGRRQFRIAAATIFVDCRRYFLFSLF